MGAINSTTTTTSNDAINQLADAAMFITSAMRLIEKVDGEAYCLLDLARNGIFDVQDYLEATDPMESLIDPDVAAMIGRVGRSH